MGSGKKKTKSTSTYKPPAWVEDASQQALDLSSTYARQPYQPYEGERISPLTRNEQQAVDIASRTSGGYEGDINAARGAIEQGMTRFTDADIDAYMNPYIKGALDPAARELREDTARQRQQLAGSLSSRGAFSGSRAILADREAAELGQQGISDLYGKGYAEAFESGADKFYRDQDAQFKGANQYMELAGLGSDLVSKDIQNLMGTGQIQRSVQQGMADFDYQQFTEGRDWNVRQAQVLTDTLRGIKGSYTEEQKTKTETKESGNALGQVLGVAATVAGAYMTGGMSLALQEGGNALLGKDSIPTNAPTGGETQTMGALSP